MVLNIYEIIIRLLLSIILSGIIGFEREYTGKPAGFRTHILVCIGATTVMIAGIMMFDQYHAYTNMDPARLGAQVISGIGFLGAGTIIREGVNIKGLTTSASIWAVGCIGLVLGNGYYALGIISTVAVFATLQIFGRIEAGSINNREEYRISFKYSNTIDTNTLFTHLSEDNIHLVKYNNQNNTMDLTIKVKEEKDYLSILEFLSNHEQISVVNSDQK